MSFSEEVRGLELFAAKCIPLTKQEHDVEYSTKKEILLHT